MILALDSSALVASVALVDEDQVLCEYSTNFKKTHSQTLLPMIDEVLRMTGISIEQVEAIAVAEGPGSFTGLRIGAATAKGLGLALHCPIIPVPTLEGMAWNFYGSDKLLCPMMDARRGQVYVGLYQFIRGAAGNSSPYMLDIVMEQTAMSLDELLKKLSELGREVVFLGDGVPVHEETIREKLDAGQGTNGNFAYTFAPPHLMLQRAASLAEYALVLQKQGKVQSAKEHQPVYLRQSQAERERSERMSMRKKLLEDPMSKKTEQDVMYRLMERKDISEVAAIEQECFSEPWSEEQIETAFEDKNYFYAVAEADGKVIGYCAMLMVAGEGQITNVAVTEKRRGSHVARGLLKRVISYTKVSDGKGQGAKMSEAKNSVRKTSGNKTAASKEVASGQQELTEYSLEVRAGNEPALALYRGLGFVEVGRRKNFYRKPDEDAVLLAYQIL